MLCNHEHMDPITDNTEDSQMGTQLYIAICPECWKAHKEDGIFSYLFVNGVPAKMKTGESLEDEL